METTYGKKIIVYKADKEKKKPKKFK